MAEIISTTIKYEGRPVKIENNKVFLQFHGTTGPGQTPHYYWAEVPFDDLRKELRKHLIENKLINQK